MDALERENLLQAQLDDVDNAIALLLSLADLKVSEESYIGTLEELYLYRARLGFKLMRLRYRRENNKL